MSEAPKELSPKEAAARLGVHPRTVRRWIRDGKLTAEKRPTTHGQQWFIPASEVEEEKVVMDIVPVRKPIGKEEFQEALGEVLEIKLSDQQEKIRREMSEEMSQLREEIAELRSQLERREQAVIEQEKGSLWSRFRSWLR